MYVLHHADKPQLYHGLPANPSISPAVTFWKGVWKPLAAIGFAATFAAAAPTSTPDSCGNDGGDDTPQTYGSFFVNKFVFGCTAGCYYSFDVSFTTTDEQYSCSGSLEDKDYVDCTGKESGASYSSFIDTTSGKNILKLQYTVNNYPNEGTVTHFYGEDQVYAATSDDADKQEASFSVDATSSTAVA